MSDLANSCESVDHVEVFRRQEVLYCEQNCVAVLETCLMFICDYGAGLIDFERAVELGGFEGWASSGM